MYRLFYLKLVFIILCPVVFSIGCSTIPSKSESFTSPYESSSYKAGPGIEKYTFNDCPQTPNAMQNLDLHDPFTDSITKMDPQSEAKFNSEKKSLVNYSKLVWRNANSYLATRNKQAADCTLRLLKDWASAGALTGSLSADPKDFRTRIQGLITREWVVGQLVNSYLKIRAAPELDSKDKEIVLSWFRKLASYSPEAVEKHPDLMTNNLLTWAGATSAVASVALGDRNLFDFSITVFKKTVDQIQDDGTLPQEMARGEMAFHYHNFALTPLSIISYFVETNGVQLWTYKDSRADKLVTLLIPTLKDPDSFAKLNGIKPNLENHDDDVGWTEFAYRRSHERTLKTYLAAHRPISEYWFDWDVTAAFGEPL